MQYVGRLVSTVYNTITPNINPATLSGAIDVIVVEKRVELEEEVEVDAAGNVLSESRDRNGANDSSAQRRTKKIKVHRTELASTPFHVRFGKMSVLRPAERKVTLHLNNNPDPLPFAMKVGDSGEAFFVLEIDDEDERDRIPDDLVTSPILSASTSPITSPDFKASGDLAEAEFVAASSSSAATGPEVEPLDLGESRTAGAASDLDEQDNDARSATTVRSGTTAETSITTPSMGASALGEVPAHREKDPSQHGQRSPKARDGQDAGDLDVPDDSGLTGSGPAGSSSLLDKVGTAASSVSGALGAAGRAAVGAGTRGNAMLEKVARKAQESDKGPVESAGISDGEKEDGYQYEPEHGGPAGKRRQQQHEQVEEDQAPQSEAERLEKQLKDRAMGVIRAQTTAHNGENTSRSTEASEKEAAEAEESYPEPFGGTAVSKPSASSLVRQAQGTVRTETSPVATARHAEYLGGQRLAAVPGIDNEHPIQPAMVDPSLFKARQRRREIEQRQQGHGKHQDDDVEETTLDEEEEDVDIDKLRVAKGRREDVQYLLDMDGYKMTVDGEDLAYEEGHRLADEMPLSRRHGGNGRHGHPEKLNGLGHNHKVSLPSTSTASLRRRSASKQHRPSVSMDFRKQKAKGRDRRGTIGALAVDDSDDDGESVSGLSVANSSGRTQHGRAQGEATASEQDELSLTRDLARLARMNRASEAAESTADPDAAGRLGRRAAGKPVETSRPRRHASLSYGRSPSDRSSPAQRATGRARQGRRRHVSEFSLSDTEAEVPTAKSASGRSSLENSTDSLKRSSRLSRLTPALRDLHLPGDETPPHVVVDDTATTHLGSSSNLSWQWGELPSKTRSGAATSSAGPSSGYRRARFASTDAYDAREHSSEMARALSRYSQDDSALTGKLTSSEWEPYVFHLQLDSASHTFELSLCYKDGFGGQGERDLYEFEENRVSFSRFVDDEEVVNDERLVVRYNDRFLTWENASTVLATLSLYRKTLSASGPSAAASEQAKGESGQTVSSRTSYWSRWWKRSSKSISDLKQASDAQEASADADPLEDARKLRESSAPPPNGLTSGSQTIERSATDSILEQKHLVATLDDVEPEKRLEQAGMAADATSGKAKAQTKPNKTYAKTLRLTSDQLKSLNLRKGANTITFSVTSSYSGVATCSARIFLWESSHKVVVSDIDGTITKSDALGHVFTMIGRDWTHIGVAKLYTDIARNGYRIMYLTSRAIGQADTTRDYLKGVKQNNYVLPDGPVIMSPDRLMASLHREVILRKPEVFKMACLRDIARLFGADPRTALAQPGGKLTDSNDEDRASDTSALEGPGVESSPSAGAATANSSLKSLESRASSPQLQSKEVKELKKEEHATPFYAGFGNRITDALSYRSVNIPSSRIFTIDSNGEVKMELLELAGYKSSYIHMTDLVDQMFPPITAKEEKEPRRPEFNDFNYWRPEIVDVELPPDDELLDPEPVSPALSARSGKSVRSTRSVRSATSDGGATSTVAEKPGRLSRFGLGSLGLSRKGSASTMSIDSTGGNVRHSSVGPGVAAEASELEEAHRAQRASSAEPELETASSFGGGSTSWTAPWRRRGTSPEPAARSERATSPLVGPVITAEPESEDEGQERFYDSEGDDDDVSSFGGRGIGEGGSEDEGQEMEFELPSARRARQQSDVDDDDEEEEEEEEEGEEDFDDANPEEDDDPLLATGEIRFEWRG